jgi:hypothetical protein
VAPSVNSLVEKQYLRCHVASNEGYGLIPIQRYIYTGSSFPVAWHPHGRLHSVRLAAFSGLTASVVTYRFVCWAPFGVSFLGLQCLAFHSLSLLSCLE